MKNNTVGEGKKQNKQTKINYIQITNNCRIKFSVLNIEIVRKNYTNLNMTHKKY